MVHAPSYRQVLHAPGVLRLLSSALCSRLGGEMLSLTVVLHVLAVHHSPALAGIVVFAAAAPGMLVSPVAGAVLDRVGARRAISVDLAASAVLVAGLAVFADHVVALVVLAALYSLTGPLGIAGLRTLMPRLVPSRALDRASALDMGAYNAVEIAGPVLAGGLFALAGGPVALAVIAVLYAAAWALLLGLHAEEPAAAPTQGVLASAWTGARHVLTHPLLRSLVVAYGLYQVGWGVLVVAVPVLVEPGSVGLLWGVAGAVGLAGSLVAGRWCRDGRERTAIAVGCLATAVALVVTGVGGFWGVATGLALAGFAGGPVNVGLLTLRQRRTDPALLGRVLAVSISLNVLGAPIGSAIGGYLAGTSALLALVVGGVAAALGALAAWVLLPRGTATA